MAWRKFVCSMTVVMLSLTPLPPPSLAGRQNASPQAVKILIYADDYYHSPNTFVDQALVTLGMPYTAYHNNQPGFIYDLGHGGPGRVGLAVPGLENFSPVKRFAPAKRMRPAPAGIWLPPRRHPRPPG